MIRSQTARNAGSSDSSAVQLILSFGLCVLLAAAIATTGWWNSEASSGYNDKQHEESQVKNCDSVLLLILATLSPSPSASPTPSHTPTQTPTVSNSRTPTPSTTSTASVTSTNSASSSKTGTPSTTPSLSASPTGTPSPTQSPSTTASLSASPTGTPSGTTTKSVTPTGTPSNSFSTTSSATLTPTTTNTLTATGTPTPSNSMTTSFTASNSPTPSTTVSVTPTISQSSTPSLSPTPSVAPTNGFSCGMGDSGVLYPTADLLVAGGGFFAPYEGYRNSWCDLVSGHAVDIIVSDNCVNVPSTQQVFSGVSQSSCTVQECGLYGCSIAACSSGCWDNSFCTRLLDGGVRPSRAATTTIIDLVDDTMYVSDPYTIVSAAFPTGRDC